MPVTIHGKRAATGFGLTVNQAVADRLAGKASEISALPELAAQHSILSLARADMPGVASRMRPFPGQYRHDAGAGPA
ncbi:hypothetical protein [Cupriavidus lacunae]|uniref:hypothetical protein n=1 Tax=Cupriavidus lacunae TaxID=2666307 RepID=UPI001FC9FE96|nr:hypothetical protein [Cupriavidus lacunae]